ERLGRERSQLHCLDAQEREKHHSQQQNAMAETRDLRFPIGPARIPDRDFNRFEPELGGAEYQIKVAERIEISEVIAAGLDAQIIGTAERFGSAQSVGEPLRKQPAEQERENLVGDKIEKLHGLLFHWVDQPRSVDEFALAGGDGVKEFRKLLRRHRKV